MERRDNAGALAGELVVLCVVVIIVAIWLMIKLYELVIRQLVAHPRCWLLWAAAVVHVLLWLILMLDSKALGNSMLSTWYVISTVVLWAVAKSVELYYSEMGEKERSYDDIKHSLFHEPWWNLKAA